MCSFHSWMLTLGQREIKGHVCMFGRSLHMIAYSALLRSHCVIWCLSMLIFSKNNVRWFFRYNAEMHATITDGKAKPVEYHRSFFQHYSFCRSFPPLLIDAICHVAI